MARRTSILIAAACAALGACRTEDQGLCGERDGDATCRELYSNRPFCNTCRVDFTGCTNIVPSPLCTVEGPLGESTGTAMITTSSDGTSSTGAMESTSMSDVADATSSHETDVDLGSSESSGGAPECREDVPTDCSPDTPYCVQGTCSACTAEHNTCPESTPVCAEDWGLCMGCREDTDCPSGQFCGDAYRCEGCTEHAQCPDSACDIATGECMDADPVLRVRACDDAGESTGSVGESSSTGAGDGEPGDSGETTDAVPEGGTAETGIPQTIGRRSASTFCSLQEAIDSGIARGGRGTILLDAATDAPYAGFAVTTAKRVAILASGDARIGDDPTYEAVYLAGGATAYLKDVRITGTGDAALKCLDRSRLWVDDAEILDNAGTGIRGDECKRLVVRRTEIVGNAGHGIDLAQNSELELRSSVVACNGRSNTADLGIRIENSRFDIRASTVAANRSSERSSNLRCVADLHHGGPLGGLIQDSIFVGQELSSVDCPWAEWSHSVVDDERLRGPGVVAVRSWSHNWFVGTCDMHLRPLNNHPFADVGHWEPGDPRYDVDGMQGRRPAQAIAAGADQPGD